ncbi:MAG: AAA family ATPase [Planctomycetota bacterium]|jgi:Mrp family chromosome partitioning ATPase|nr:AAA family ATPase [Planctomycetota bacterium]
MSADEAFANLMREKRLVIPAAKTAPRFTPIPGTGFEPAPEPSRPLVVDGFIEQRTPDYQPPAGTGTLDAVASGRPTETGMKPVSDEDAREIDDGADSNDIPDSVRLDAVEAGAAGANLGRARRVKRFNYLPFEEGAKFDVQAMDFAAGVISRSPGLPSILVTSVQRGEGRTELALRLALALARRIGTRVLLADFDLRRPQAALRLGVSAKYFTLTDVLRGACPMEEALAVSDEDGLYVLPSRTSDRIGDEIIDARALGAFMDAVHGNFDFAVFDCPPADHTDTLNLCRHAGSAVLCGFSGLTSAWRLNAAARRLSTTGIAVAGMALLGE